MQSSDGAPKDYATAMLKRTKVVFDELKQGVLDLQSLADPTTGEVSIGYSNVIAATALFPKIIELFSEKYPRVIMHVDLVPSRSANFLPGLRDRNFDLIFARLPTSLSEEHSVDDISIEFLFDDPLVVVAGTPSRWARRRKIDLAEIAEEPWSLPPPKAWSYERVAEAFKAKGLSMPKARLLTYSMDLRAKLSAGGRFITVVPKSMRRLEGDQHSLKMLPVDLPARAWPIAILDVDQSDLEPRGRTLHRMRTRGGKFHG